MTITVGPAQRRKAADIIERLQKTFGMDIPEVAMKLGVKSNYLYSIVGGYRHRNGTPHAPAEAVRSVIEWGAKA